MSNDKYPRNQRSIRLRDYDYSSPGAYFVTICANERKNLFAAIVNGQMQENRFGAIVRECWDDLPHRYANVELDEFILMPNHLHGIVVILDKPVAAIHGSPLPRIKQRRNMLLPKIVGRFKMNSAKRINMLRNAAGSPVWQRDYFEHIIRNEQSLARI